MESLTKSELLEILVQLTEGYERLFRKISTHAILTPEYLNAQKAIRILGGSTWIDSSVELPADGENVEISEDGINTLGTADYKTDRRCMLAGASGGHGYFSSLGFATDGKNGEDRNLILDTPPFWRRY